MTWRAHCGNLAVIAALALIAGCGGSENGGPSTTLSVPPQGSAIEQIPNTGNPQGDAGTLTFVVNVTGSDSMNLSFVDAGMPGQFENRLTVFKSGAYLRVLLADSTGAESNIGVPIAGWVAGRPHAIAVTWGDGVSQVFIDGQLVSHVGYEGTLQLPPGTPLYLGSAVDAVAGATGVITDFKAFGHSLTPDQVAALAGSVPAGGPTPIPASTPAPPITADVTLRVESTHATEPDGSGSVCVALAGGGGLVAGTQNDLVWPADCVTIEDACEASSRHGKSVFAQRHGEALMRVLLFSLTNVDPIDDGVLYCCPYHLVSVASGSCCPVSLRDVLASDSQGDRIPIAGVDGQICAP